MSRPASELNAKGRPRRGRSHSARGSSRRKVGKRSARSVSVPSTMRGRSTSRIGSVMRSVSRALTRTATSRTAVGSSDPHGVFEKYHDRIHVKGRKHSGKAQGYFKFYDQYYQTIQSKEGQQGVSLCGIVGQSADLVTGAFPGGSYQPANTGSRGGGGANNAWSGYYTKQVMIDLDPASKLPGGNYYNAAVPEMKQMVLDSVKLHFSLGNFQNTACIVDMMILACTQDQTADCINAWIDAQGKQALSPDLYAGDQSAYAGVLGAYVPPVQGGVRITDLGQSPNTVRSFKKLWHPVKHRTFEMSADTNIEWDVTFNYKKLIDQFELQTRNHATGADYYYKGLTFQILCRLRGQVVKDSSLGSIGIGQTLNASISASEIGLTCVREYTCHSINVANKSVSETAIPYLISSGTNASAYTVSNETIVNVLDAAAAVTTLIA